MSGDAGDLRGPSGPTDGGPLRFPPDPDTRAPNVTPDLGNPSRFTNEALIAGQTAKYIAQNKGPEAVKYLLDREHAHAQEHPGDDQRRYWTSITQDLTSGCHVSFEYLQQVAKKEFGIKLSDQTPPTEAMYQSTLHPPREVQGDDRQKVEHGGTLRVPPLVPGEHTQTPEHPHTSEPSKAPGKVFPWKV